MTKVEELLQELEGVKNEMKSLQKENKTNEAYDKLSVIDGLKKQIEIEKALENVEKQEIENKIEKGDVENMNKKVLNEKEKAFVDYIRDGVITNAILKSGSGALIPEEISTKIIEKATELSPIVAKVTRFINGADMKFIKESTIPTFAYVTEGEDSAKTDATFTTVVLKSHLASCECVISKSLINGTDVDVLNYIIQALAKSLVKFLEKELIVGTSSKMEGVLATTNKVESAEAKKIKADELIDTQALIPTSLQGGCEWIINPTNFKEIRKLKGTDGQYLCGNMVDGFGYTLLGKPVFLSDQMPENKMFYGDVSGLYVKFTTKVDTAILREKYASAHQLGVLSFVECDSKIVEDQKLAQYNVKQM